MYRCLWIVPFEMTCFLCIFYHNKNKKCKNIRLFFNMYPKHFCSFVEKK